ncbi:2785_t:CDS:2 [Entrophospora sp. SA101]|nr:2785_t:CDS:2 [Entrophospora sp. SA101]
MSVLLVVVDNIIVVSELSDRVSEVSALYSPVQLLIPQEVIKDGNSRES